MSNNVSSNAVRLMSGLFFMLILIAFTGCQDGVDTQSGIEAAGASKKATAEKEKGKATVIMDGKELPVSHLVCNFRERGDIIAINFDLEPRGYTDLNIEAPPSHDRQSPRVTLRLATELNDERGFDLWKSEEEKNLPITETGVSGTFEIEGEDRGHGARESAMLEVNVVCPSR